MYSWACRSRTNTRLELPRCTMLAIIGPVRSPAWVCHSLRRRFDVRYSVRVSENEPVTWRVTIFTPFHEGSGYRKAMRRSDNTRILTSFPRPTPDVGPYCNPDVLPSEKFVC